MQFDPLDGALALAGVSAELAPLPAPRWEWRAFSRGTPWMPKVAAYVKGPPELAIRDTYLLSARSVNNVRMLEHHIEVKERDIVAPDGMEFWRHTMRLTCPLGARELAELFRVWGLDDPGTQRPCWSVRQFEHQIIDPRPDLLAMPVVKRRTRLEVCGCAGEYVDLLVMGEHWESVAVYDADALRVRAAVDELGLDQFANTSYPDALSAMAGLAGRH